MKCPLFSKRGFPGFDGSGSTPNAVIRIKYPPSVLSIIVTAAESTCLQSWDG